MTDTFTPNYNLVLPTVGGDINTWGALINGNTTAIDTAMKANADAAAAASTAATAASAHADTVCPVGAIIMWNSTAAAIPSNFQLCDGTNATPDLRGRFIIGAGPAFANGSTGGAASMAISVNNLPPHAHGVIDPGHVHPVGDGGHLHGVNDPGHAHSYNADITQGGINIPRAAGGGLSTFETFATNSAGTGIGIQPSSANIAVQAAGSNISIQNTGSGTPLGVLPPYYALCFIQRMS